MTCRRFRATNGVCRPYRSSPHLKGALPALLVAFLATGGSAHAAQEIALGLTYDPRIPVGQFRAFTPDAALNGFQFKWDYYALDALSVGFEVQYQMFQRGTETDTVAIPNGAVTAPNFRSATFWSFLPTVSYYFLPGALRPYASIAAGVSSTTTKVLVSDLSQHDTGGAFILQPSVGVLWRLSPEPKRVEEHAAGFSQKHLESMFGLMASVTYAFTTADVAGASNIAYAGVELGVYVKP